MRPRIIFVLAVSATIIVAGSIAAYSTVAQKSTPLQPGPGGSPISSALAFSNPTVNTSGNAYWYNASVVWVNGTFDYSAFVFDVLNSNDLHITPGQSWFIQVSSGNSPRSPLLVYNFSAGNPGAWEGNSDVSVSAGQVLTLFSGGDSLSGDPLRVIGIAQVTGDLLLPLP